MLNVKISGITNVLAEIQAEIAANELAIKAKLVAALKKATPVDTGHARDGWQLAAGKIINNVDYISELNGGSSRQAPSHFVEQTVLNSPDVKPSGTIVLYR